MKGNGKPALNSDLWSVLLDLTEFHQVNFYWVKGHSSNDKNNRCDQLAVAECMKIKNNKSSGG